MLNQEGCHMTQDWTKLAGDLERLLKLRAIPFGMKLFESRGEMEAIPRIRRPKSVHTLDQVVAQAARLGWTVGITSEDLVGAQCRAVVGLGLAKDENGAPASTWSGSGTAHPRTREHIRRQWNACPTAVTRRSRWRRWRAAGSTRRTSRCSTRRPAR